MATTLLRSGGLTVWTFWQNAAQLQIYGTQANTLLDNAGVVQSRSRLHPPLLKVTLPLTETTAALKLCTLYGVTGATLSPDYGGAARATEDIMSTAMHI
jgi:hypothetical protein